MKGRINTNLRIVLSVLFCICMILVIYCSVSKTVRESGYINGKLAAYSEMYNEDLLHTQQ